MDKLAINAMVFEFTYNFRTPTHMAIKLVETKRLIKHINGHPDVDMDTFNNICNYCNWLRNTSRSLSYNIGSVSNYYLYVQMQNKLNSEVNELDINKPFAELTKFQKVRRYIYYTECRSHGLMHYHPRTNTPMDEYLYEIIKYDHRLLKLVEMFKKFKQIKPMVENVLE